MNKRLKKDIGQTVAEKRGWKTALTDFAYEIWGDTEEDMQESPRENNLNRMEH